MTQPPVMMPKTGWATALAHLGYGTLERRRVGFFFLFLTGTFARGELPTAPGLVPIDDPPAAFGAVAAPRCGSSIRLDFVLQR
jgi:hypothetical protein